MKKAIQLGFLCLVLAGCGNNSTEQDYFLSAPPVEVIDPVHQQDLINLEAPDEDEEQEKIHLELVEAFNKKVQIIEEIEFETRTKVPDEIVNDPIKKESSAEKHDPVKKNEPVKPVKKEDPIKKENPVKKEVIVEVSEDIRKPFEGRPSLYYMPVLSEERSCAKEKRVHMRDPQGKILAQLCRNEILNCAMQGSCYYLNANEIRLFAYSTHVNVKLPKSDKVIREPRFKINHDLDECPFGMGFRKICLDPYRSIAADMKFHKSGDVVYIPLLDGQVLPNGEIHDGYMIVRDIGQAILGEGRFDFFIGFDHFIDHLFMRLKLADKNKNSFTYYKVPESEAQLVRKARAFPSIPQAGKITTLSILKEQKNQKVTQNKTGTR